MRQTIVITDLTQMPYPHENQACVVGITKTGECIRPVCAGGFLKNYLYIDDEVAIRPGARVESDFTSAKVEAPHIEDKTFDPDSLTSHGFCTDIEWEQVLRNSSFSKVEDISDGFLQDRKWVKPGAQARSIATLSRVATLSVQLPEWNGKLRYRLSFKDGSGNTFNSPVSDLTFRELCYKEVKRVGRSPSALASELTSLFRNANRVYLRLGLARPWIQPGLSEARCYLQVTGIYTFPDYLQGKTFADFLT